MPRRAVTFAAAAVLVVLMILGGALLPVPYVAQLPGPAQNVLGTVDGQRLISIQGRETYGASGQLDLVTVAYRGSPGYQLHVLTALRGWLDPQIAVLPQRTVFPEGRTAEQVRKMSARRMRASQQNATVAALRELDVPVRVTAVRVGRVSQQWPAQGKLRRGDVILRVDGKKIAGPGEVSQRVSAHRPGETVAFTVRRGGERTRVRVGTVAAPRSPNKAMVGVVMDTKYDYPLQVDIRTGRIGGPSAGLMFALGVVDKLSKESLTGGKHIAGTGTIASTGRVGQVDGVAQKMVGARQAGAQAFLVPAQSCDSARQVKPPGMRLVKVRTLHGAVESLRALREGGGGVPGC